MAELLNTQITFLDIDVGKAIKDLELLCLDLSCNGKKLLKRKIKKQKCKVPQRLNNVLGEYIQRNAICLVNKSMLDVPEVYWMTSPNSF